MLHGLFDSSEESVAVSVGFSIRYVNPACAALFGYPDPSALVGKPVLDLGSNAREMIGEFARRRGVGSKVPTQYVSRGLR